MASKSVLYKDEAVENRGRKFGSAIEYFPCWIVRRDGTQVPALFTQYSIQEAVARAASNPEDMPEMAKWLERIFA